MIFQNQLQVNGKRNKFKLNVNYKNAIINFAKKNRGKSQFNGPQESLESYESQ